MERETIPEERLMQGNMGPPPVVGRSVDQDIARSRLGASGWEVLMTRRTPSDDLLRRSVAPDGRAIGRTRNGRRKWCFMEDVRWLRKQ